MPKLEKNFFSFVKGLNTEVSELRFPDDTALAMNNMELRVSGRLERRKGIKIEAGHGTGNLGSKVYSGSDAFSKFTWHGPGADSSLTFQVVQIGPQLLFYLDSDTLSTNSVIFDDTAANKFDLTPYQTSSLFSTVPCTFSEGRSKLFIANPYLESLYLTYDPVTNSLTPTVLAPLIRNFEDAVDDVPLDKSPDLTEMPTITDRHFFNLKIRGWKSADITQYSVDKSKWPSKAMSWVQGYQRKAPGGGNLATSTLNPTKWLNEWNSNLMETELFGTDSAARGALLYSPYDSTSMQGSSASVSVIAIGNWTASNYSASNWYLTIPTATPHGKVPGDKIDITGNAFKAKIGGADFYGSIDCSNVTCEVGTAGSTVYITIPTPVPGWTSWQNQYKAGGFVNTLSLTNPDPYTTTARPSAVGYWAGRIWLSGMEHPKLSDLIMFSQVAQDDARYNKMYQERDPTSPNLSSLLPDDGGVIQIPGMIACKRIIGVGNSLILVASNGVWEISGGRNFFGADSYNVRRLSDVEASSTLGIDKTDYGIVYTSPRGVFVVTGDEQTQSLTAQSITEATLTTLWNDIPDDCLKYTQLIYDSAMKRIKILYCSTFNAVNPYGYDRELIYDMRLQAWFPYSYPLSLTTGYICGMLATDASDQANENRKVKYFVVTPSSDGFLIGDNYSPAQVPQRFDDWDGTEQDFYVITGYDNIGDFSNKRQAPFVTVFSNRTEVLSDGSFDNEVFTGGEVAGTPINFGSLFVQARWDWSDSAESGKWGTKQQCYRPKKFSLAPVPDNGEPVLTAKVKIRGHGRSLHLRFSGEVAQDLVLIGWSIIYRTTRNNVS